MKNSSLVLALVLVLSVIASAAAKAAPIQSDSLAIRGPNGSILFGIVVTDAQESACGTPSVNPITNGQPLAGGCLFAFNPLQIGGNLNLEGRPTLVYEPDGVTLSDVFGVWCFARDQNGTCTSGSPAFVSEIPGQQIDISQLGDTSNDFVVVECGTCGGTAFDATQYLDPSVQGYSATFFSVNDQVPEPPTLPLLGLCIVGLAMIRIRRFGHGICWQRSG